MVNATATAKKGKIRSRSHLVRGRCHKTIPSSNTGRIATDPLLNMAKTKAKKLSQCQSGEWRDEGGGWDSHAPLRESAGAMPTLAPGMPAFRYHRIDSRKNSTANMSFLCEIQATDSTFTGCRAKIMAAKKPPGMDNFRRMIQIRRAPAMCNIKFVR